MSDPLDALFSSRTRVRVLREIIKLKEINITRLTKVLGINYQTVNYHVNVLRELGIIEEKRFGRIRVIRVRQNNPIVSKLEKFFNEVYGGDAQ